MKKFLTISLAYFLYFNVSAMNVFPSEPGIFTIARLQYGGGGDWYSDPSSLPNLLRFIDNNTTLRTDSREARVKVESENLFRYPVLYMTGHGDIRFTKTESARLRDYLTSGGFLFADDNYGMDASFRREIRKIFPDKDLVELPKSHGIFRIHYNFQNGLPKIHEHDNKPARAFGIFHEGRLVLFYSYESDLGDGWEDASVHGDSEERREAALKMGTNVIIWALTH